MSFQGIEAGKAFVEFLIKDDKLDSGLLKVGDKLKKFGTIGLTATGPILAAFAACAAVFASTGSELHDMSVKTGLSVESLSELSYAAKQSGTDLDVVAKASKALEEKGISPTEFDNIANSLAGVSDNTERAQRAMDVFGSKAGFALLPLLQDLPKLREEARQLGVVMSTEDATAADRLGDAWGAAKSQFTALVGQVGAAVAGPISDFLEFSQGIVASVIEWVHNNSWLVRTIAEVTAAVAACSAAAIVFGTILTIITLHPIVAALTLIAAAILGIVNYFGLASDGAGDFSKKLDGIQSPGGGRTNSPLNQQAMDVQSKLNALSPGGQLTSPLTPSVMESANRDSSTKLEELGQKQLVALYDILSVLKFPPGTVRGAIWGGV